MWFYNGKAVHIFSTDDSIPEMLELGYDLYLGLSNEFISSWEKMRGLRLAA